MPSKYLHGFYGFFALAIAVFGIISMVFSFLWRRDDLLLNMVFSDSDLTGACWLDPSTFPSFSRQCLSLAGLVLGIALLLTSFLSIGAIIQRNHVTIGLVVLNWVLIADALIALIVGTIVWFYTLRERAEFHTQYGKLQDSQRVTIQDKVSQHFYPYPAFLTSLNCDQFSCCGYFDASDLVVYNGTFCQSPAFVNSLNTSVLSNFCVTPITEYADTSLNNVFTYVRFC